MKCETTVKAGDGAIEVELWPMTAPYGVQRLIDLVDDEFFTDLPFYHAQPHMFLFGLHPDYKKQRAQERKGDVRDDPFPSVGIPGEPGLLCFSGDPGKPPFGKDSRSHILFFTRDEKHLLSNRRTPWEVPIGKIVKGLDVLAAINDEYGDQPMMGMLNSTNVNRPAGYPDAAKYWAHYPNFDKFRSCEVVRDRQPASDPMANRPHDEL